MSKERLNSEDICPHYCSNYEEGSCMECCEFYNRNECAVVYVNGLEKQVADLEAKLAESEKLKDDALYNYAWLNQEVSDVRQKLKDNEDTYKTLCYNYQNLGKAYNELEQQLAEKDKEINDSKIMLNARGITIAGLLNDKNKLKQQLAEKDNLLKMYPRLEDMYPQLPTIVISNQDKISLCIEKLEKVKELCIKINNKNQKLGVQKEPNLENLATIIDNQIKQLKEMK